MVLTLEGALTSRSGLLLKQEIETRLKEASLISMGTEISQEDLSSINDLATQVCEMCDPYISRIPYLALLLGP